MPDDKPQEIQEFEIPDVSPARQINPIEFFTPGGNPVGGRDFRPSTFVFKNDDDEDDKDEPTEDGHGNMRQAVPHTPVHPSQNRRKLRRSGSQQELEFPPDLVPDPSGEPQTEEEVKHPAGSEEPKNAPGITGSKRNQPEQE